MRKIEDLKFLIPQINFRVGDIEHNLSQIIDSIKDGESNNVDFILYPELALSGYPPRDILYYDRFLNQVSKQKNIISIGIAFSFQEAKKIPSEKHDKKLDYILTEKNLIS